MSAPASITESALRAAVNQLPLNSCGSDAAEVLASLAKEKATSLVLANSDSDNSSSQIELQGAAIELALKGIALGAMAVSSQVATMQQQRLSFDKERQSGIASFIIPTNKEFKKLSKQEQVLQSYVTAIKESSFANYLAIKTDNLQEQAKVDFYSILPFYRMSAELRQPVGSRNKLDQQQVLISLFFRSALPESIADIDAEFTNDNSFHEFFESAWQKDNYLNNLRAPRFIMMSLANLLWNLQNPVGQDGLPLSVIRRIDLCQDVLLFLNSLLNKDAEPRIDLISNDDINLVNFIRRVELHVKSLKEAFEEEKLHAVNVNGVTDSAHRALRTVDKSVLKLIYKRTVAGKDGLFPDEHAAQKIACKYLSKSYLVFCPDCFQNVI